MAKYLGKPKKRICVWGLLTHGHLIPMTFKGMPNDDYKSRVK
jgi:hypothetical protein